jgi:hypothetical protein
VLLSLLSTPAAQAGTYVGTLASFNAPTDPKYVPPYAIVHPIGYTGGGGTINVNICLVPGSEVMTASVDYAIALWNGLVPTTGNCVGCVLAEETAPTVGRVQGVSGILHELGHCAMGLDHMNLNETTRVPSDVSTGSCDVNSDGLCGEVTSFTASVNASRIVHDPLLPLGVKTDEHLDDCPIEGEPPKIGRENSSPVTGDLLDHETLTCLLGMSCPVPPTCCLATPPTVPIQVEDISWYRISDNNPVIVDSTVIDKDSYSRSVTNLPSGSSYAASANRAVAENLGFNNTQSVMYSAIARNQTYKSLSADDVNMVKMGMTGADRDAEASPDDDYTIVLHRVPDCSAADISVALSNSDIPDPGTPDLPFTPGQCRTAAEKSFPQGVAPFHWSLVPASGHSKLEVQINPNFKWEFLLFEDGFEWVSSTSSG